MHPDDHCDRALQALVDGDLERAATEYYEALRAHPDFPIALHGLAQTYARQGRLDDAVAVARRLSELHPDDILAHTSLSRFLQAQGKVPEAEAEANKARVLGWKQQLKQKKDRPPNLIKLAE